MALAIKLLTMDVVKCLYFIVSSVRLVTDKTVKTAGHPIKQNEMKEPSVSDLGIVYNIISF